MHKSFALTRIKASDKKLDNNRFDNAAVNGDKDDNSGIIGGIHQKF